MNAPAWDALKRGLEWQLSEWLPRFAILAPKVIRWFPAIRERIIA
jgi:hypothetical protein